MFNKNFYPTPKDVISIMIDDIKYLYDYNILEPSAGKGDIIDYIIEKNTHKYGCNISKENIYCIESDIELQHILRDKGYQLLDNDFLTHNSDIIYDYIIMNPPFDDGAKHLLKAFEISKGAEIRCLLNAETIKNPYSKERQLLEEIIKQNNGEIIELGKCFSKSERKTNIDIVMVKLKDNNYENEFNFDGYSKYENEFNYENIQHNDIARNDHFDVLETKYNKIKQLFSEYLKLKSEMEYYTKDLIMDSDSIEDMIIESQPTSYNNKDYYNSFVTKLKTSSWKNIFKNTKINSVITNKVKDDITKNQLQQSKMAFTKDNIDKLFVDLYMNKDNIMKSCVSEAFDIMTKYYDENRCHIEGWKTNDQWKVNRKVILPYMRDSFMPKNYVDINYDSRETIEDIEKALCFITGKVFVNCNSIIKVTRENTLALGKWHDSEFFEFKMFKKGTMHFKFKDEYTYQQFNIIACEGKNWLGQ